MAVGQCDEALAAQAAWAGHAVDDAVGGAGLGQAADDGGTGNLGHVARPGGQGVEPGPQLARVLEAGRGHLAEVEIVFGKDKRAAACGKSGAIALENGGDGVFQPHPADLGTGGKADQAAGVEDGPDLVEVVHAPDKPASESRHVPKFSTCRSPTASAMGADC